MNKTIKLFALHILIGLIPTLILLKSAYEFIEGLSPIRAWTILSTGPIGILMWGVELDLVISLILAITSRVILAIIFTSLETYFKMRWPSRTSDILCSIGLTLFGYYFIVISQQ